MASRETLGSCMRSSLCDSHAIWFLRSGTRCRYVLGIHFVIFIKHDKLGSLKLEIYVVVSFNSYNDGYIALIALPYQKGWHDMWTHLRGHTAAGFLHLLRQCLNNITPHPKPVDSMATIAR